MKPAYHAYEGTRPYIFISYAHKDADAVLPVVAEFMNRKYRVWYDEGLEVGDDWPEIVAGRLAGASHVVVFTSAHSAKSPNCVREVNYAVDRRKQLSRVQLDDVVPEGAMGLQLSVAPTADARALTPEAVCDRLEQMGCLTEAVLGDGVEGYTERSYETKKRINKWMLIAAVFAVLFLAAVGVSLGLTRGWFGDAGIQSGRVSYGENSGRADESFTYTEWNDPVSRDLLLSTMNGSSMYLCGNAFVSSAYGIDYRDGQWRLGDLVVQPGDYTDFSAIAAKGKVTELAMVYQNISSLQDVDTLPELTYLDISGNPIADLSPLQQLQHLKVLRVMHLPEADLSALLQLPSLQRVYISVDMVAQAECLLHSDFDVVIKE